MPSRGLRLPAAFALCLLLSVVRPSLGMFYGGQGIQSKSAVAQQDRIAARPDLNAMTRLPGHVPSWATAGNDAGAVPDNTPLRLTLVLSRAPEREAAFQKLLADQQNPGSSAYH